MLLLKHFRHYYWKYLSAFVLGVLILISIDWLQLEIPRIIKVIIDNVEDGIIVEIDQLWPLLSQILIIVVVMTIGRFLWRYLLFGTSRKIETDLRNVMFAHVSTLDHSFYANQKIGGLMAYFINDLSAIRDLFGFGLLMLVDGLVLGALVIYRMLMLQPIMTLYALIPMVLLGILVFFLEKKMEMKFKARLESFEHLSEKTQESYSGIMVIKAYVREMAESLAFKHKSKDVYDKSMEHMKYSIMVNIIIDAMISLVILAIIGYGSILIAYGNLSSGELTEYINYFFTLLWPVFALSYFVNVNAQAQASAKRIYDLLETKPAIIDQPDALTTVSLDGSISIRNLSFRYPDAQEPVLKEISFDIHKGEFVGILGKTGSGKSTLVELLLHLHSIDEKTIFFGEYDTTEISIRALRDHIGYVPQDNFIFSDTIKNNIGFALDYLPDDELTRIAQLADLHENIAAFSEGYETVLGERGVTVSGGQKQRIAIARALAKDPTILILDDSVSAVDTKTEAAILANLRRIREGRTTILIAHRISTVKKLDKIVLIDQGRLVGYGSHTELLATSSLYQEMVSLQELEALVGEDMNYA